MRVSVWASVFVWVSSICLFTRTLGLRAPRGTIVLIVALDIFYAVKLTQKDLQDLPAGPSTRVCMCGKVLSRNKARNYATYFFILFPSPTHSLVRSSAWWLVALASFIGKVMKLQPGGDLESGAFQLWADYGNANGNLSPAFMQLLMTSDGWQWVN